MNIQLVKLSPEYKTQLFAMMEEWTEDVKVNRSNPAPSVIFKNDFRDFDEYLKNLDRHEEKDEGHVPTSTFFGYDAVRDIFVGAVNIRHYLTESLLQMGGHIGDGVRPSERRKGYATAMIALALKECKKMGINRVLMTCSKDNIGSAKSIVKNGGILENEVAGTERITQRYWIDLV